MSQFVSNVIKKVSNQNIDIKRNYKLLRILQKIINPSIINNNNYDDVIFHMGGRDIRARVFNANKNHKKLKMIIFIHGGGWVTGSIESYTKTCLELSERTKRLVISIDYRLAPEYPYPAGFNDCYDVIKLIMDNLSILNLKEKDVCLMGDSAGGNLVAAISLKAKDTKDFKIGGQILLYPALQSDYSTKTKYRSVIENGKDYLLTQRMLQDYMSLYVKDISLLKSPYVSPLKYKFPFRQPSTLLITADHDPLRDEGKSYAQKLKLCLNKVTYYNFKDAMHGFLSQPIGNKHKIKAYDKIIEFLGDDNE